MNDRQKSGLENYPRNEYISRVRYESKENTKKLKCNSKIILGFYYLPIGILPISV